MADKLLKSIKFPTLPDRYVIGDTTLTEEGAAAEAKAVGEALATKADTKGRYEDIVAGGAEQLMADGYETDKEPYLFRPTGGSADVGNREYLDKIVGGTVAWNQLAPELNASNWRANTTYGTVSYGTNSVTYTSTEKNGNQSINRPNAIGGVPMVQNHKYFLGFNITISQASPRVWVQVMDSQWAAKFSVSANKKTYCASVFSSENATGGNAYLGIFPYFITGIDVGETFTIDSVNIFDLTALFNPTIADYIYSLEQSQAGAGVAWFRRYFPEDYYPYHAVSLESVQATAHKTYDADGNVIGTYPLDSSLTLRGVPKLVDGKLAFDGDVYPPSGEVQRRYGLRAYQSGDESLTDAIMDGTNTVYKLATPTTETADGYEHYHICDPSGTEAFVTTGIVPVGHETRYPHDLKKKIETAPDSPSTDGTYLMKRSGGKNTYMALPSTPSANGAYVLTVTVSGGSASYSWTAKE